MIKKRFSDKVLSMLGYSLSSLPVMVSGIDDGTKRQTLKMIDCAMSGEINYYDAGWIHFNDPAAGFIREALSEYPRESFYLANRYPANIFKYAGDAERVFEAQLKAFGTDHFDFYVAHSVDDATIDYFPNRSKEDMDYFIKQKKLGRIKHLGFTAYGVPDNIDRFLKAYPECDEFCQVSVNYYDWRRYQIKSKLEKLEERNVPVWIKGPLKGGKLAELSEKYMSILRMLNRDESAVGWSFKFAKSVLNARLVICGASKVEHLRENIELFRDDSTIGAKEFAILYSIADDMINADIGLSGE